MLWKEDASLPGGGGRFSKNAKIVEALRSEAPKG
jgi:hypothetical protein